MSLGRIKLKEFIKKAKSKKVLQNDIAVAIGCSRSYLSELLNGIKKAPSIEFAGRIEKVTRVKIGDWNKSEEGTELNE